MAGFFQDRWNGVKNGLGTLYEGGSRVLKQALGWQNIPESSPGVIGWLIETGRAAINGLFSKEKGLLRLDQGYKLSPLEKESIWNPFRHVRRGVSAVLNTATTFTTKFVGILNPTVGNFWSRALQGASTTVLAPFIGDISPYLGPTEPSAYNDGSYKVKHPEYYGAANDNKYGETYPKAMLPAPAAVNPAPPQPMPPPMPPEPTPQVQITTNQPAVVTPAANHQNAAPVAKAA